MVMCFLAIAVLLGTFGWKQHIENTLYCYTNQIIDMKKIAFVFIVVISTFFISCTDTTYTGTLNIRDFHSNDIPIITTIDSLESLFGSCDKCAERYYRKILKTGIRDKKIQYESISYWQKGLQYMKIEDSVQLLIVDFRKQYSLYHNEKCLNNKTTLEEMLKYFEIDVPISELYTSIITLNGEILDGYSFSYDCNDEFFASMSFDFDTNGYLLQMNFGADNGGILNNI